jgi:2-amino-4-hydroxy-6-hydroxymethyldihydropteridine diphosphokinase
LKIVYLSLGSNMGEREEHLREALRRLETIEVRVLRKSSVYETEPQDMHDQPWFLNLVVEIETEFFPMQLLAWTQKIERDMGRERLTPKGPRTIDIDILFYGRAVVDTPKLAIPHPRLAQRRFVLEPLGELAPDLRHPVDCKTVREMLTATQGQRLRITEIKV